MRKHVWAWSAVAAALAFASSAGAAEFRPFSAKDFAASQAAGKPILVDVAASWCPICKAQAPVVDKYTAEPRFKDLIVYRLDFDTQKADWRRFGVGMQSTLIAFHGPKETARSVGETGAKAIAGLIDSTTR